MKKATKSRSAIKPVAVIEKVSTAIVVASLEKQAMPEFRRLTNLTVIKTKEEYEKAADSIKALKVLSGLAKEKELRITDPLRVSLKETQSLFRPFQEKVKAVEDVTKNAMLNFLDAQKKLAAKVESDFEDGKIKKVSTVVAKQNELRIDNGVAQVRKVWTLFIDDASAVPRNFLTPDESAIREEFKTGGKVKGCRWEQVETIAI